MNTFQLEQYLSDYSVKFKKKEKTKSTKFELKECVFDSSHINNDACIFQYKDTGIVVYKCQHNSCSEYEWRDAKKKISGDDKLPQYWSVQGTPVNNTTISSRDDISYIDFGKILETKIKIEPIIRGMIYKGDQTIIHGPGGVGKSLLVLYLSLYLACADEHDATDELWHDFRIMKSKRILFLQAENNQANMHNRLKNMCDGNEVLKKGVENLFTVSSHDDVILTGESFADESFCTWLIDFIKKLETEKDIKLDILIVDPLISFYGSDENDASKMRAALDGITKVCQQAKITPIVIHHDNRSGKYRGSSAIRDWARNMIGLKEEIIASQKVVKSDSDNKPNTFEKVELKCIKLKHEKCNYHKLFKSFLLKIDENLNLIAVDETLSPEKTEQYQNVAKVLKDMGGEADSMNALAKAYSNYSGLGLTTCRKHVALAAEHNFVKRIKNNLNSNKHYKFKMIK